MDFNAKFGSKLNCKAHQMVRILNHWTQVGQVWARPGALVVLTTVILVRGEQSQRVQGQLLAIVVQGWKKATSWNNMIIFPSGFFTFPVSYILYFYIFLLPCFKEGISCAFHPCNLIFHFTYADTVSIEMLALWYPLP